MSDETEKKLQDIYDRAASGQPVIAFDFDQTMQVAFTPEGGVVLDCPCGALGGTDLATVVRVSLTPAAAGKLAVDLQKAAQSLDIDWQALAKTRRLD
ncbi:hypothetical protein C0V97_03970 [Asaia sp. W19]|nr:MULTISPECIES: hypothetical protein [unclassified Asaia]MDL2169785.1 hypothetical protein [Asaia sp. HumB]RUT26845.1 hypothetical protein C0V97_03970 [Asaia sp. W19]